MQFKAVHIEGSINMRADVLSRFQMSPFREVASNAAQHHAETPIEFLNIISSLKYIFLFWISRLLRYSENISKRVEIVWLI